MFLFCFVILLGWGWGEVDFYQLNTLSLSSRIYRVYGFEVFWGWIESWCPLKIVTDYSEFDRNERLRVEHDRNRYEKAPECERTNVKISCLSWRSISAANGGNYVWRIRNVANIFPGLVFCFKHYVPIKQTMAKHVILSE